MGDNTKELLSESSEPAPFPWQIGIYDAHCHPTDTLDGLHDIPRMRTRVLTIMATREQDQELVSNAFAANELDPSRLTPDANAEDLQCQILPAFGWHPWFSHHMYDDTDGSAVPEHTEHYQRVLQPTPEDEDFLRELRLPQSLTGYLQTTRWYLERHPNALIGEVGLDRAMRIPENTTEGRAVDPEPGLTPGGRENRRLSPYRIDMAHQAKILVAQLRLAGEMQRAVSVHGVAAHGFLYDTLEGTWKGHERRKINRKEQKRMHPDDLREQDRAAPKPFPPRICLHSFSGPAETVKQYLRKTVPVEIFFSFSMVVNFSHGSQKAVEAMKAVPDDRILIESDLHRAGERMDGLLEEVTRLVCEVKGWELEAGVRQLARNWKHFALGIDND